MHEGVVSRNRSHLKSSSIDDWKPYGAISLFSFFFFLQLMGSLAQQPILEEPPSYK